MTAGWEALNHLVYVRRRPATFSHKIFLKIFLFNIFNCRDLKTLIIHLTSRNKKFLNSLKQRCDSDQFKIADKAWEDGHLL